MTAMLVFKRLTALAAMMGARSRAGLTQAQIARRMKTTQTAIARLESGRVMPSTRTLKRFAHATGHRLVIGFEPVNAGRSKLDRTQSPDRRSTIKPRTKETG